MDKRQFNKVRKSLLMSWKVCPRQAWYSVRDVDYGQYNEFNLKDPSLLLGQIFHKEMDRFYSRIDISKMIPMVDDENALQKYLMDGFGNTTNEKCLKYFNWYSLIEAQRFIELYKTAQTGIIQRFIPLYIEKFVEYYDDNFGIHRNGHFDRVDYLGNKELRLVEYKTGQSYDVTKSYKLTKLRLELYWYKNIIERMKEFEGYTVTEWMMINPTLESVFSSKFSILTEKSLDTAVPLLADDINMPEPPDRNLNFFCHRCKYKQECLINIKENIFDI